MRVRKRKRYQFFIVLLLLGILLILFAAVLFLRLRGSVAIKPSKLELPAQSITAYRQDEAAWADDLLGESSYTMAFSGCLVTCIASAVSMETGTAITPGSLNAIFSENHVYDSEGNIQWAALEALEGFTVDVGQEVSQPALDTCLAAGHAPIVRVRMHGLGSFHYVLIVGAEEGDYICMDPLADRLTKLSDYLGRVYAVRVVSCRP